MSSPLGIVPLEIVPLAEGHLPEAAALVARRYRALREGVPALPPRYGNATAILEMLQGFALRWPGAAALRGGALVGFLVACPLPDFRGRRSVYSPEWANGAELGDSRRIYEALYTALAPRWTANGCFSHVVAVLAHDRAGLEAWHWLGFGHLAGDAVRDLTPIQGLAPSSTQIRRAGVEDLERVFALHEALGRYLAAPPTYLALDELPEREALLPWLTREDRALWIACAGEQALACASDGALAYMRFGPANEDASTIIRDPQTASITGAYTRPEARGQGLGAALLNAGLAWAQDRGHVRCAVDFEPMNVLGARFWMRHFQPVCFGLARHVDERVAWAGAERRASDIW